MQFIRVRINQYFYLLKQKPLKVAVLSAFAAALLYFCFFAVLVFVDVIFGSNGLSSDVWFLFPTILVNTLEHLPFWFLIGAVLLEGGLRMSNREQSNTWKFRTIVYFVIGISFLFLLGSFGLVFLILFWAFAYFSYRSGSKDVQESDESDTLRKKKESSIGKITDKYEALAQLKELLDKEAITQEEYEKEKGSLLKS
jgi:hypothetical protein